MRSHPEPNDVGRSENDFIDMVRDQERRRGRRLSSSERAQRGIYLALVPIVGFAMVLIPMASVKTSQVWQEVSQLSGELERAQVVVQQERILDDIRTTTSANEMREKIQEARESGVFDSEAKQLFAGESRAEVAAKVEGIRHALRTGDLTKIPPDLAKRAKAVLGKGGVEAAKAKLRSMPREQAERLVMQQLSELGISVSEAKAMAGAR